jgi:hypothetical protein
MRLSKLYAAVAGGEAGGLGEADCDRLLQRLVVAVDEVAQLRHGHVVVEPVGGKRHRPPDQPVDQSRSHGCALPAWCPLASPSRPGYG